MPQITPHGDHDKGVVDVAPDDAKHEAAVKRYPNLNLSKGEFVIAAISRGSLGIFEIWLTATVAVLAIVAFTFALLYGVEVAGAARRLVELGLVMLALLVYAFAYAAASIYAGNQLFITNESVIQEKQTSLLARKEQTINLSRVLNVDYSQRGLFESLFGYGTLTLTTDGENGIFQFGHADEPKQRAALITNTVEAYNSYHNTSD